MTHLRTPCEEVAITRCSPPTKSSKHEKWILVATILGSSLAFIDGTVVNVALVTIQNVLHATINQLQWVVEAYALTLATLLIIGGSLGDIYGRRRVFLIGVVMFTIASIGCGFAMTIMQLNIARAIQGIGAALLVPGSLALISASFSEEQRGQAIGTWAAFTSIMAAAGPLIGGWLAQHASWRWIFFLNVPLAISVFIVSLLYVEESKNSQLDGKLDLPGATLVVLGLGAIIFGLIEWQHSISTILTIEILGILLLIGFFWVEVHSSSPMLPLTMFRSRNFSAVNVITFFLYFALYGVLFFLPLDLIQIQGYTTTQAGAALLPLILLIFLLSRWSGGLVKQIGPRLPLVVGPTLVALGYALFIPANFRVSYWTSFFPATVILGLGMAISVAPLTTVVMSSISENYVGAASGVNNAISRIAGLLAVAILGLVLTMQFNQQLEKKLSSSTLPSQVQQAIVAQESKLAAIKTSDPLVQQFIQASFISGYETVLWIAVSLSLMSALTAGIFIGVNIKR